MLNKTINGYNIKRKLGEGGMAEVWYAENELGKAAAVKFLKEKFCKDTNIVERFINEAKVMVKLNHPNVRQVYDYKEIDSQPCIIMEYLEGEDLKEKRKIDSYTAVLYWNQIVAALTYTHKKGVVHRDIKPSNIFVTREGYVKLLDFGIAKVRDVVTGTQTGQKLGTLLYMSPEQITDAKRVDYRTDIYSLAVTFVHLLSGRTPYDMDSSSDYAIMDQIVKQPLDMAGVPSEWRVFLKPYLEKEPDKRPELSMFATKTGLVSGGQTDTFVERETYSKPKVSPQPRNSHNFKKKNIIVPVFVVSILLAAFAIYLFMKGNNNGNDILEQENEVNKEAIFFDDYKELRIGDYVYEDGMFSHDRSMDKPILGIVFSLETTANERNNGWTHGLIVASEDCGNGEYYMWSKSETELPYPHMAVNLENTDLGLKDKQGYLYTYKGATNSSSFPAFTAARNHKPRLKNGSGWYLPTLGQWAVILKNLGGVEINTLRGIDFDSETAFNNLKNSGFSNDYYWTATEQSEYGVWVIYLGQGDVDGYTGKTRKCKVRAVCAF